MAHDIRATARARLRRWRARKRAERELAEHVARQTAVEGRRARGRANTAAWRARREARKAVLNALIARSWFAPPTSIDEMAARIAAEHGGDRSYGRERAEAYWRGCTAEGLNLTPYALRNGIFKATVQRALFSEAVESGSTIPEAVNHSATAQFVPEGNSDIQRYINRKERLDSARWKWFGREQEIVDALLGKRKINDEDGYARVRQSDER